MAGDRIEDAIYAASKVERQKKVGALRDEVEAAIKERAPETTDFEIEQVFEYIQKKAFRLSIMEKGRGTHFDPRVLDAFFARIDDIEIIRERCRDDETCCP